MFVKKCIFCRYTETKTILYMTYFHLLPPDTAEGPLDLAVLLDLTADYNDLPLPWATVRQLLGDIIATSGLRVRSGESRVSLWRCGEPSQLVFGLGHHAAMSSVLRAVSQISYVISDVSSPAPGLRDLSERGFHESGPGRARLALVVTDRGPGPSQHGQAAREAAARLHRQGVHILTLGLGAAVDPSLLAGMASPPRAHGVTYWHSTYYNNTLDLVTAVGTELRRWLLRATGRYWGGGGGWHWQLCYCTLLM